MEKSILIIVFIFSNAACMGQYHQKMVANTGSWKAANCYQAFLASDLNVNFAGQDGGIFNWRGIQPNFGDPYLWNATDSVVRCLQANGVELIPTLRCINPAGMAPDYGDTAYILASQNGGILRSWAPKDTVAWKNFVAAVVERYDGDHISDMPFLTIPVKHWRIETEWQAYWLSPFPNDSLPSVQNFVNYERMTYNQIRQSDLWAKISFGGLDTRHDRICFYEGYTNETSYCSSNDCMNPLIVTRAGLDTNSVFQAMRRNTYYLLRNALYDELDIHSYGRWQYIPAVMQWLRDSITNGNIPIMFLEGGGPFCNLCEPVSPVQDRLRNQSSYVIWYYLTSLFEGASMVSWHISPEYNSFNSAFGDMDLLDSTIVSGGYQKRPAYFAYRFLSKDVFGHPNAVYLDRIPETDSLLHHYHIRPLDMHVIWSEADSSAFTINCGGYINRWDIPVLAGDTTVSFSQVMIPGSSYTFNLNDGVPVFYSSMSQIGIEKQVTETDCRIYPNPFSRSAKILFDIESPKATEWNIVDLSGRDMTLHFEMNRNGKSAELLSEGVAPGVYFFRVRKSGCEWKTYKMVLY